ncbi:similar to serine hydolase like protein, isoforms Serhl-2 (predicted) [Rattus norvegicus]|uniref:Similar to serine hydolase like protein, isoforms Serhl-2 (Predicted) n=1 Tax=Rattus norvegicus TaxID=10116 RepID=A6HT81_RAT|nr:serine hydrolase-like protein 2 [Rattus norvegicus]EDM15641.1 similar to serine hydolase like protein, isoforms Serhl-2 (predicted) [Rattus norvegicus]|eukprot:NP_001124051.1 serine hydrolase-like protein 2 [Rattus norvegicus]
MGLLSELKLAVPWGHIAVKVWGLQKNPPVLCLHGWLDNANSFDKLIPFLPKDFCYVAMDFGGHGLSTHYSPGLPYYHHNFVSEVRRVVSAFKWTRLSLLGHSFGGVVGGLFACMFPEMVDKLILLDSTPLLMDLNEVENIMTYRRKNIEQTLKVEDSQKPPGIFSPEEMLHELLTKNSHLNEDCGELLLQRGTTKVAEGLVLNRDQRLSWPQYSFDFMGKELTMHSLRRLQASVLIIKALDGYYDVRRENDLNKASFLLMLDILRSTLKERFQFVEIPGNHYIHMNKPQIVADIIRSFLQGPPRTTPSRL